MRLDSIIRVGEMAAGAFAVGWANDSYISPAAEKIIPSLASDHTASKAIDTATCLATTIAASKIADVASPRVGRAIEEGGLVLTGMKAISTLIPGVEVKTSIPNPLSLFRAQKAASGTPTTTTTTTPSSGASSAAPVIPTGGNAAAALPAPSGASAQTNVGAVPNTYFFPNYGGSLNPSLSVGA